MADFLGGLLSGGGGLYDDLLTPQQQSQLSSRGLLAMAGAFADAGMPSRLPIPLGAAIGKAAAAMGGGRDEAALQAAAGAEAVAGSAEPEGYRLRCSSNFGRSAQGTMSDLVKAVMRGSVPGVGIPTGATSAAPAAAAPPGARPGAVPPGAFSAVPASADQGAALDAAQTSLSRTLLSSRRRPQHYPVRYAAQTRPLQIWPWAWCWAPGRRSG